MSVPTYHNLDFYSDPKTNLLRYDNLKSTFTENFSQKPEFFSRSPGRVNLIGDHIDYNFFLVLPMAIDVDVVAAVGTNDSSKLVLTNTNPKFTKQVIELPDDGSVVEIDHDNFSWASYFSCGLIVAHKYILEKQGKRTLKLTGLNLCFDGTVPTGGGLSSSAAFCVASTLAVLRANGIHEISKSDLTQITVVSEHYVGVNNGGMDQCASIYGENSKALFILFRPKLIGVPFQFPKLHDDLVFLITNSLMVSNKHETAPIYYNLRVIEMAIGADLIAKKFNLHVALDSNAGTASLRGVMDAYFTQHKKEAPWDGEDIDIGVARLNAMDDVVEQVFTNKKGYTSLEVAQILGISEDQFRTRYLTKIPVRFEVLKLYQRAKHVFAEACKVLLFLSELRSFSGDDDSFLAKIGTIMNSSQESLDKLNESSNETLNSICNIALQNGLFGSRVTGAGWGGSVVHVTTKLRLGHLVASLEQNYYRKRNPEITDSELKEAIVISSPAAGSCIVEV